MATETEDFESGTHDTTVAEDIYDSTFATFRYDDTQYVSGSMSGLVDSSTTSGNYITVPTSNVFYARMYVRFGDNWPPNDPNTVVFRFSSNTTSRCQVRISNSGVLEIRNAASLVDTASGAETLEEWFRLEWFWDGASGDQELRIFRGANLHGTTADEVLTGAASTSTANRLYTGFVTNPSGSTQMWLDDVGYDESDWMGPTGGGGPTETPLTLDASATGSVAMSKPTSRLRSLSPSVSVTATLARPASLFRTLAAGATATPSASRVTSRLRTLAASAAGTGTVARVTARARDLSATATGTAALASSKVFLRTLTVAVSGAASLARPAQLARTLSAAATGAVTLTKGLVLSKTLSASAAATASMGRLLSKAVTLSATATATPSLSRTLALFRTLSSSATGTVSMALGKTLSKTLSVSATAVASMTRTGFGTAYAVTLDALATGTAALSWLNVVVQIRVRRARAVAALTYPWLNKNYRDRTGPWLRRD